MTVQELFRAGNLKGAIQALGVEVRDNPADVRRRTFLFELLCFAGEFERAEKHLNILADANADAAVGALLYRSALRAERQRLAFFEAEQYNSEDASNPVTSRPGTLNGERFETIEDADARVGARLEAFLAGEYVWLPWEHLGSVTMEAPRTLRDLLWPTLYITGGKALEGKELGEALAPALSPFSFKQERDSVKLGRETEWSGDIPYGQKMLVLDGERIVPFLEIRTLEFDSVPAEEAPATAVP
jgi:type VI secretion system protein ImpE